MTDPILHHFDISPFAEKARLIFGLKNLNWQSVQIPLVMPKDDMTALTGGYRKTPVMQIGAEIYCDSNRIARELERRFPQPTLFPDGNAGLSIALSYWSNSDFFNPGAGLSMGVNTEIPEDILTDRKTFFNFMDFDKLAEEVPHLYTQLIAHVELVEEQLADGNEYLLGSTPGWIDINAYFVIWMVRNNVAPVNDMLSPYKNMHAWEQRIKSIGHGNQIEMDANDAIAIARETKAEPGKGVDDSDPLALKERDRIIVEPDDYGKVPVEGNLITLNRTEVSIQREDERAGIVNVHFPRIGYRIFKS